MGELESVMNHSHVAAYFSALDLDVKQVRKLFDLIDLDKSGSIDRSEFIFGCLRLKGSAKSLDVAILDNEIKYIRQALVSLSGNINARFQLLESMTASRHVSTCADGGNRENTDTPL